MFAKIASIIALSVLVAWSVPSLADPPSYAPAHGWRRHHEHHDRRDDEDRRHDEDSDRDDDDRRDDDSSYYVDDTSERREPDYGILSGHCNREAVATALGGVVGGVLASRVAKSENRTVATILGAAAGALIGRKIGHELDEADRGCFGHALEIGKTGRRVTWTGAASVRYEMVPGAYRERNGVPCRSFTLWAIANGRKSSQVGIACRSQPDLWQVVD